MTPDWTVPIRPRDVSQAFAVALVSANASGEMQWLAELDTSGGVPPGVEPTHDAALASKVAARVNDLLDEQGVTSAALVEVALVMRNSPVLRIARTPAMSLERWTGLNRSLAAEAAYVLIVQLAIRGRLVREAYDHDRIFRLLSAPGAPDAFKLAAQLEWVPPSRAPRPLVVLLTPLAQVVDDAAQAELLEVAYAVRDVLPTEAAQVIIPGEVLHPSSRVDNDPGELYFAERDLLLRASLVVVIAGQYDSWGAACATVWCEANGAHVMVLVDSPHRISRVLGAGPFDTEVVSAMRPGDAAGSVSDVFARRRISLAAHAADLWEVDQRIATIGSQSISNASSATVAARPQLSPRRRNAVLSSPRELDSLTLREARAMFRGGGEDAIVLLRQLLDIDRTTRMSSADESSSVAGVAEDE